MYTPCKNDLTDCMFSGSPLTEGYCSNCFKFKTLIEHKTPMERIQVLSQFSNIVKPLITKYNTASMLCGYHALANAEVLSDLFKPNLESGFTSEDVTQMVDVLTNEDLMVPYIEKYIQYILEDRETYIALHQGDFNETERKNYKRDWVANYEIAKMMTKAQLNGVYFMRHLNKGVGIDLSTLKHEEKERLAEEAEFDGHQCVIQDKDNMVTLDEFARSDMKGNGIFIMDVLGHFNVGIVTLGDAVPKVYILDSGLVSMSYIVPKALYLLCVEKNADYSTA